MSNVIELPYESPTGPKKAYVFLDEEGRVTSEKGLSALVAALKSAKPGSTASLPANDLEDFLNLSRTCRPEWQAMRIAYEAELQAADAAGCTSCDKSAIARKYVKMLNHAENAGLTVGA